MGMSSRPFGSGLSAASTGLTPESGIVLKVCTVVNASAPIRRQEPLAAQPGAPVAALKSMNRYWPPGVSSLSARSWLGLKNAPRDVGGLPTYGPEGSPCTRSPEGHATVSTHRNAIVTGEFRTGLAPATGDQLLWAARRMMAPVVVMAARTSV